MNGAHDAGGQMGYGRVRHETDEPVFHAAWERRLFGLSLANGCGWTIDEDRAAGEALPPLKYITTSYYEHWLHSMETMLRQRGYATAGEIATGRMSEPPKDVTPTLAAAIGPALIARYSYRRDVTRPPQFTLGDKVRARRINPQTHTRLPRYLRGHFGSIIFNHGAHVFPDSNAVGHGENPQYLYTVEFKASDVWGTTTASTICADLWEPYLEAL
jgi:nitrile hydratase